MVRQCLMGRVSVSAVSTTGVGEACAPVRRLSQTSVGAPSPLSALPCPFAPPCPFAGNRPNCLSRRLALRCSSRLPGASVSTCSSWRSVAMPRAFRAASGCCLRFRLALRHSYVRSLARTQTRTDAPAHKRARTTAPRHLHPGRHACKCTRAAHAQVNSIIVTLACFNMFIPIPDFDVRFQPVRASPASPGSCSLHNSAHLFTARGAP